MKSFYSEIELKSLGLKSYGHDVLISRKCSLYNAEKILIGNNVRIDDFCILSGNLTIGSNIHISSYVALYGAEGIVLEDFTGISSRTTIYSAMDDFSGNFLIGPIHPVSAVKVTGGIVIIQKYSQIGCNCVIFPNLTIGEGCVVGACSMVRDNLYPWGIYYGIPVVRQKERSNNLLQYKY